MKKNAAQITDEIKAIFATKWETRKGNVVPEAEAITLLNQAVQLEGTVLYADIADSTDLVDGFKDWFAAEIYKSYLIAACRLIENNSGVITAFDGDRIMAVYIGTAKNSSAATTALQLSWAVSEINKLLPAAYPNTSFRLKHSVGIDSSNLYVAKTGIRNSNDLVWVGRAANYAAKLAGKSEGGDGIFITEPVFKALNESAKMGGNPKSQMWYKVDWDFKGIPIYTSNWTWKP